MCVLLKTKVTGNSVFQASSRRKDPQKANWCNHNVLGCSQPDTFSHHNKETKKRTQVGFLPAAVQVSRVCESINHPIRIWKMVACIHASSPGFPVIGKCRVPGGATPDENSTIAHILKTDQNQSATWLWITALRGQVMCDVGIFKGLRRLRGGRNLTSETCRARSRERRVSGLRL